jgi:hypothetical protein
MASLTNEVAAAASAAASAAAPAAASAAASAAGVSHPVKSQTLILAAYHNAPTKGTAVSHPPAEEVVRALEEQFGTDAYNAAKVLHVCFGISLPHGLASLVVTCVDAFVSRFAGDLQTVGDMAMTCGQQTGKEPLLVHHIMLETCRLAKLPMNDLYVRVCTLKTSSCFLPSLIMLYHAFAGSL